MVQILDDHVGLILQKLKELSIDNHTVVIFTSDNGHEIYYALEGRVHKPYTNMTTGDIFDNKTRKYYSQLAGDVFDGNGGRAGMKRSNLQGGIAVPLIVRWPQTIRPGRTSHRLVANYDIMATVADLCNYRKKLATDGLSFYDELTEEQGAQEHDFIVFSSFTGPTLLTNDGWKIRTSLDTELFELFYLPDDFREENDLSASHPQKLKELKAKLHEVCSGDFKNGLYSYRRNQTKIE
jgi:arylsulfatase A-like enzyme